MPDVFAAVRAVEGTRHQFQSTEDRQAFARLGRRPYTLAAIVAGGLGRSSLFVEVLERMRAQGLPAAEPVTLREGGHPQPAHQALSDLIVAEPQFATVSGGSEIEPGRAALPLRDLVATVAGGTAWWWTCQILGDGVAWAVRTPRGQLVTDIVPLPDDRSEWLGRLAAWFRSPTEYRNLAGHPLAEDRDARLDEILREAAGLLLPQPLVDAARAAAIVGSPIRLVWAPPPEFGNLPVGLLPIGERHRLLHGAAITFAPPTSLLTVVRPAQPRAGQIRETVVLGHDPHLSHAVDIVGPAGLGVPAARVTGTQRHVRRDTCRGERRGDARFRAPAVAESVAVAGLVLRPCGPRRSGFAADDEPPAQRSDEGPRRTVGGAGVPGARPARRTRGGRPLRLLVDRADHVGHRGVVGLRGGVALAGVAASARIAMGVGRLRGHGIVHRRSGHAPPDGP